MDLLNRYSKNSYQGSRIRKAVELIGSMQVREVPALPSESRVDRRLSGETIAELVQAYQGGMTTAQLRQRYSLSQGSVIKLLRQHGVPMRRQGLTDEQIETAIQKYEAGQSLATIGRKLGVDHGTVWRALKKRGVQMRDTRGNPRKK